MKNTSYRIDNRKDVMLLLLYSPGKSQKANEPISGRTRLMKLLFLFYKEIILSLPSFKSIEEEKQHKFKPYRYGPFSKDLFDDLQFLENAGLVKEETGGELSIAESSETRFFYDEVLIEPIESQEVTENYLEPIFSLTDKGINFVEQCYNMLHPRERRAFREFKSKFNSLRLAILLRYVYKTYPESAEVSVIRTSL